MQEDVHPASSSTFCMFIDLTLCFDTVKACVPGLSQEIELLHTGPHGENFSSALAPCDGFHAEAHTL